MKERNYGIELLRGVGAFLVIILHLISFGGLLLNQNITLNILTENALWAANIISYVAVDVFAVITGYVSWDKNRRWEHLVETWCVVFFYSVSFFILNMILRNSFNLLTMIQSFFPILSVRYWYFTEWVAVFALEPFFNKSIASMNQETYSRLIKVLIVLFSIIPLISAQFRVDNIFSVGGGYSFLWLTVCYFIGAYYSKYRGNTRLENIGGRY